ncbi:hypothetical protein AX16_001838 [Volvariella volvacea WC 439]|nr:hypothetical protein AX16_001838 [Volvariella volvacea WC 439]
MSSERVSTRNRVLGRVTAPPRTWYGAEFYQEDLPYSRAPTHATPTDITLEHGFWKKHIENYPSNPPTILNTITPLLRTTYIDKLPTELLCEILRYAVWTPSSYIDSHGVIEVEKENPQNMNLNPLLLGQVCIRWRNIARSMPQLWSTIQLFNPGPSQAHLTELYLTRSGANAPLTLSLRQGKTVILTGPAQLRESNETATAILSLFVKQIHRWRGVEFMLYSGAAQFLSIDNGIAPGAARSLEVAHIQSVGWLQEVDDGLRKWRTKWEKCVWECIGNSPVLKSLTWSTTRSNPLMPTTQWGRMTHLGLAFKCPKQFFRVLPHLQEMQVLRYCCPSAISHTSPPPPIVLAKLEILELKVHNLSHVLQHITAPALKEVCIVAKTITTTDAAHFHEFLSRSQCSITHITLTAQAHFQTASNENAILQYLNTEALKGVQVIVINACIGDATVSLFHAGSFLSLRQLFLPHCRTTDGLVGVTAGIRMRMEGGTGIIPIKTMRVGFVGMGNHKDIHAIEDLMKTGYDIKIVSC